MNINNFNFQQNLFFYPKADFIQFQPWIPSQLGDKSCKISLNQSVGRLTVQCLIETAAAALQVINVANLVGITDKTETCRRPRVNEFICCQLMSNTFLLGCSHRL